MPVYRTVALQAQPLAVDKPVPMSAGTMSLTVGIESQAPSSDGTSAEQSKIPVPVGPPAVVIVPSQGGPITSYGIVGFIFVFCPSYVRHYKCDRTVTEKIPR